MLKNLSKYGVLPLLAGLAISAGCGGATYRSDKLNGLASISVPQGWPSKATAGGYIYSTPCHSISLIAFKTKLNVAQVLSSYNIIPIVYRSIALGPNVEVYGLGGDVTVQLLLSARGRCASNQDDADLRVVQRAFLTAQTHAR